MVIKKITPRPHDQFFCDVYLNEQYARELLHLVLPSEDLGRFDWTTLATKKRGRADLVFSVKLKYSFQVAKIIFLLEHKSFQNRKILQQLLRYQTTLYADYEVPIIPIVIYHGKKQWKVPRSFQAGLIPSPTELLGENLAGKVLNFSYLLLDISQLNEEKLWSKRLTSGIILYILKRIWFLGDEVIGQLFTKAQDLLPRENREILLERICHYICDFDPRFDWEILRRIEAMNVKEENRVIYELPRFEARKRREAQRERREARKEGLQEGLQKGQRSIVLNMIRAKMELKTIAKLTGLSEGEVAKLARQEN